MPPETEAAVASLEATRSSRLFNGPFLRLWLAQVVASLGDWIGLVAILAIADRLAGGGSSGTSIGVVMLARMAPGLLPRLGRRRAGRPLEPQAGARPVQPRPGRHPVHAALRRHGVGAGAGLARPRGPDAAVVAGQGGRGPQPGADGQAVGRQLPLPRGRLRDLPGGGGALGRAVQAGRAHQRPGHRRHQPRVGGDLLQRPRLHRVGRPDLDDPHAPAGAGGPTAGSTCARPSTS